MAIYADTSALVKLVVAEPETTALRKWLSGTAPQLVACDLVRTELVRAVRRAVPERIPLARQVLDTLVLTRVRADVFEQAGRLNPIDLRSLDAVHLAAALDLGDDLDAVLTYDDRLTTAALAHGIPVEAPA